MNILRLSFNLQFNAYSQNYFTNCCSAVGNLQSMKGRMRVIRNWQVLNYFLWDNKLLVNIQFPVISSNSCPLNLMLVRSHQAEVIILKRFIQECNNVTRVHVEQRSCDPGHCKNNTFTLSVTLPTNLTQHVPCTK